MSFPFLPGGLLLPAPPQIPQIPQIPAPALPPLSLLLVTPWLPVRIPEPGAGREPGAAGAQAVSPALPKSSAESFKEPLALIPDSSFPTIFTGEDSSAELSCSAASFFPREIIPSVIPADFCHISGPVPPQKKPFLTGISAALPLSPASVNPDGCNPLGFVAFATSCPFLSHPRSALSQQQPQGSTQSFVLSIPWAWNPRELSQPR